MTHLTTTEKRLLVLLAQGFPYHELRQSIGCTLSCLHTHLANLRRKTGITNTKDRRECKAFFDGFVEAQREKHLPGQPTRSQMAVLRLFAEGRTHQQIATQLGLTVGTTMNAVSQGKIRAGLKGCSRERLVEWLERQDNPALPETEASVETAARMHCPLDPMDDPMF